MVGALHGADLFVCASLFEGYGLPFLEAQCTGLPCVGFDCSAIPEVVMSGQTGCLVPREDTRALADAIVALAEDSRTRRQMSRVAVELARRRCWSAAADRLARVFEKR